MDESIKQDHGQQEPAKVKKERKRRTPEERLALLMEQERKAKEIAKNRSKAIKDLQEKAKSAKLERILKRVKDEGLSEMEFLDFVSDVLNQLISDIKNRKRD